MTDESENNPLDMSGDSGDKETHYFPSKSATAKTDIPTDDIYEEKAMLIVEQLIERGIFHLDDTKPVLYHEPTGHSFESVINAAHFHSGWTESSES